MNITIQGVDITLTQEQIKQLRSKLPKQGKPETLEEVYQQLGIDRDSVVPFRYPVNKSQKRSNAVVDIEHIALALNGDWVADFSDERQTKYLPYFRKTPGARGGWVVFSYVGRYCSNACGGFGLYFKDSYTALYAGNTFLFVYIDYLP